MTQVKNTKSATTTSFIAHLDALAAKRNVFQIDYDVVNKTLYDLLADCLSLYRYYQSAKEAQESIVKAIKNNLIARKLYEEKKHTTTLSLIVRYVFDINNRRANHYVRVLSVAINLKKSTADFASWMEKEGGLDEVLSQKSFTQQTIARKAVLSYKVSQVKLDLNIMLTQPLAVIPESPLLDLADIPDYTMLLGKTLPDGTTLVLSVVPNTTEAMWTGALAKIAKAEMEREQKMELAQLQASNDDSNDVSGDDLIDLLALAS